MHQLSLTEIKQFKAAFAAEPANAIKARATVNVGVKAASYEASIAGKLNRTFSIELPTDNVTNQKQSGRCWLFAALNTLRHDFAKKYHAKNFLLSQNYLFFWDRLERANIFFDHILETADKPLSDREVSFYLQGPDTDGGQWAMAVSLIQKYGLVPSYAQPESFNANATDDFNALLNKKLRENALILRRLQVAGDTDIIEQKRQEFLTEVYRMAVIAFGQPVEHFDLEYQDDDKKPQLTKNLTPLTFLHDYFSDDLGDYVTLFNAPDHDYQKLYAFPFEDNVQGGTPVQFLNVPIEALKAAAIKQLSAGEAIWFGCDVGQSSDRKKGILANGLYQTDALFDIKSGLTKAERLATHDSGSTHAMTLVGVDVDQGEIRQWKIENSWGEKVGQKGYFVMSDDWFSDYVFKVVINKKYLPAELVKLAEGPATPLPCWDPMG
ncbi:MAG: C1 family peptidase [Lactobacillus sp.]|nr:C1 family peptidase [Lactobacillus sp.]MDN6042975.1 C1 family peptidase [Lactobacillus sp.]MDN6052972.1 C1 family peptidase [Lactobacillus sp.]